MIPIIFVVDFLGGLIFIDIKTKVSDTYFMNKKL